MRREVFTAALLAAGSLGTCEGWNRTLGVSAAIQAGELAVERPGVVVNMPLTRWPGGER